MSYGMFIKAKKSITNRKSPVSLIFSKDVLLLNCKSNVITVIVFTGCTTYLITIFHTSKARFTKGIECSKAMIRRTRVSTMKPRKNGRYLVDNIFKMTFLMKIIAFWFKFHHSFFCNSAIYMKSVKQATSQYLHQWWHRLPMHIFINRLQWVDKGTH